MVRIRDIEVHAAEESQCRTCVHQHNRMWANSLSAVMAAEATGDDLSCHPPLRYRIQRLTPQGPKPLGGPGATGELIADCGWQIEQKCIGCARFVPEEITVAGGTNANGRTWFRQVTVGGHCSIPAEGILVDGVTTHCDRKPKHPVERDKSCANCANLVPSWVTSDLSQYNHVTPVQFDLTPFEMAKARAAAPEGRVGLEIWQRREILGNVPAPIGPEATRWTWCAPGLSKFYLADVIETTTSIPEEIIRDAEFKTVHVYEDKTDSEAEAWITWGRHIYRNTVEFRAHYRPTTHKSHAGTHKELVVLPVFAQRPPVPETVTVRFRGPGTVATLSLHSSDDTTGIVYRTTNPTKVVVELTSPWHRRYGLSDHDWITPRKYPLITCPSCNGEVTKPSSDWHKTGCGRCSDRGKISEVFNTPLLRPSVGHLVDDDCPRCAPGAPCYWHAKAPRVIAVNENNEVTDQVYYRPHGVRPLKIEGAARALHVSAEGVVTDGEGNEPHPAVFRIRLRSLIANHRSHATAIRSQFARAHHQLAPAKSYHVNLAFGRFLSIESAKPYCSAFVADPDRGLDLTELFGNRFGDPRAVMGTNPAYDRGDKHRDAGDSYFSWIKWIELTDWQMVTDLGSRVQEEIAASDAHLYFHREGKIIPAFAMPENVSVEQLPLIVNEAEPDKAIWSTTDYQHWLDRTVDEPLSDEDPWTRRVSHRWQIHGYEQFRHHSLKKGRDMPETVVFKPIETTDQADDTPRIGFWCSRESCGTYYAVDEINDAADPRCQSELDDGRICNSPLSFFERDLEESQGHLRVPYTRIGSPRLAGGLNSSRWNTDAQLLATVCDDWRPRRGRGRDSIRPKRTLSSSDDTAHLIGVKLSLEIEGEIYDLTIGETVNVHAPVVQGFRAWSGDADSFSYEGGYGKSLEAKVLGVEGISS